MLTNAANGIVITHDNTICKRVFHCSSLTCFTSSTLIPSTLPTMMCVVDKGTPIAENVNVMNAVLT